jgi:hypothetical protein
LQVYLERMVIPVIIVLQTPPLQTGLRPVAIMGDSVNNFLLPIAAGVHSISYEITGEPPSNSGVRHATLIAPAAPVLRVSSTSLGEKGTVGMAK